MLSTHTTIRTLGLLFTLMVASLAILSGCGKKEKSQTQVVARVDSEEISIHQINGVLSKMGQIAPQNLQTLRREALQGLVDQQIAVNLAVAKKLERSPEVVTAIENAKHEILARAVVDQVLANLPKPTDDDARKYFAENPALFSQRRIFNLQEISFPKNALLDMSDIRSKVAAARSLSEVAAALKLKNVDFKASEGTRAAEQLPLEILPKLQELKDGQISLIEGGEATLVIRLVSSRVAPVSDTQALPRIKQFLFNQSAAEAVKASKNEWRSKAKIEYFGEFASAGSGSGASGTGAAGVQVPVDPSTPVEAKTEHRRQPVAEVDAKELPQSANIEKGIKGLK